jgi:hypothetical protein
MSDMLLVARAGAELRQRADDEHGHRHPDGSLLGSLAVTAERTTARRNELGLTRPTSPAC